MHDTITIGIPVLAILFGVLLNQRGLEKLESRMDARIDKVHSELTGRMNRMQSELTGRIDRIQAGLLQFYRILGEHGADIATLKEDRRKP